jgi:hypothetical protein
LSSTTKDKRIRRIERRGSPELVDALRRGLISSRMADSLFYLPHEEQRRLLSKGGNLRGMNKGEFGPR